MPNDVDFILLRRENDHNRLLLSHLHSALSSHPLSLTPAPVPQKSHPLGTIPKRPLWWGGAVGLPEEYFRYLFGVSLGMYKELVEVDDRARTTNKRRRTEAGAAAAPATSTPQLHDLGERAAQARLSICRSILLGLRSVLCDVTTDRHLAWSPCSSSPSYSPDSLRRDVTSARLLLAATLRHHPDATLSPSPTSLYDACSVAALSSRLAPATLVGDRYVGIIVELAERRETAAWQREADGSPCSRKRRRLCSGDADRGAAPLACSVVVGHDGCVWDAVACPQLGPVSLSAALSTRFAHASSLSQVHATSALYDTTGRRSEEAAGAAREADRLSILARSSVESSGLRQLQREADETQAPLDWQTIKLVLRLHNFRVRRLAFVSAFLNDVQR